MPGNFTSKKIIDHEQPNYIHAHGGANVIIPINNKLRIRGTEQSWQLERAVTRKGVQDWQAFKYFTTLCSAVGEACRREIRTHPANGLTDAIQAVDQIVANYARVFDEALELANSKLAA